MIIREHTDVFKGDFSGEGGLVTWEYLSIEEFFMRKGNFIQTKLRNREREISMEGETDFPALLKKRSEMK